MFTFKILLHTFSIMGNEGGKPQVSDAFPRVLLQEDKVRFITFNL